MRKKNDCFKCPYVASVPGSAHKSCKHPSVMKPHIMFGLPVLIAGGLVELENDDGVKLLEFHPTGIRGGWCVYPINFDPIWVTCRLSIEKDQED
jgi:hypothetical protein